jgi:peptidase E
MRKPKQVFAYGSGRIVPQFLNYARTLTSKSRPKMCFLPTATADDEDYINRWYEACEGLEIEPSVLKVWINSVEHQKSWEELLLPMDAIIVGGGNTLNMMAIWQAQGIDTVLKKAYENGTVMLGGSAGSLCWFNDGTTDSRPKELSIVKCLGFLNYSHCPHYHSEASRIPLYHENIRTGKLGQGYACDDRAGVHFVDGKFKTAVALDKQNNSYFVSLKDGQVHEEKLNTELLQD